MTQAGADSPSHLPSSFRRTAGGSSFPTGQVATRAAAGDFSALFGLLPNPDPVLKKMGKDMHVYRDLLVDPLVKSGRHRRIAAVLVMERGLDSDRLADTPEQVRRAVEAMLARLDIQTIVRNLMDGAFFGYRVGEVMWGQTDLGAAPVDLMAKPCEWFGFEGEDSALRFRRRGSIAGEAVPDRKFIVVGRMRTWDNPYGEPDLAACFWPVVFKRGGLRFWATFTEKYGMPWAVGKLPRTAQPKEVEDLADKLAAMVRDAVAVVPDDASVELLTVASSANAELYQKLLAFCGSEITIALLGNNQSTQIAANLASARAARQVEDSLRDDDAQMVAGGINQLIEWFCAVNYPGATPPVYTFRARRKIDELQASRDAKLHAAGANFENSYFQRTYGLREGDLASPLPNVRAARMVQRAAK